MPRRAAPYTHRSPPPPLQHTRGPSACVRARAHRPSLRCACREAEAARRPSTRSRRRPADSDARRCGEPGRADRLKGSVTGVRIKECEASRCKRDLRRARATAKCLITCVRAAGRVPAARRLCTPWSSGRAAAAAPACEIAFAARGPPRGSDCSAARAASAAAASARAACAPPSPASPVAAPRLAAAGTTRSTRRMRRPRAARPRPPETRKKTYAHARRNAHGARARACAARGHVHARREG
eukprot:5806030-Pleurochrysis_carterae.AAC.1